MAGQSQSFVEVDKINDQKIINNNVFKGKNYR